MTKTKAITKLPAGKYWIGDPCYVLDVRDKESSLEFDWDKFCSFGFDGDDSGRTNEGAVDHQGIQFAFYGTAWGDGCYPDQFGNRYGVDAGIIGCIPVEAIEGKIDKEWMSRLGTVHDFEDDFKSSYNDGTITFGDVSIRTGDDED